MATQSRGYWPRKIRLLMVEGLPDSRTDEPNPSGIAFDRAGLEAQLFLQIMDIGTACLEG